MSHRRVGAGPGAGDHAGADGVDDWQSRRVSAVLAPCVSVLLLALASVPTFGQEIRGPYVGFGIDQIDYSSTNYRIEMDDKAISQKFIAGFRFKETLAFEAHYAQSDDFVANFSGFVTP